MTQPEPQKAELSQGRVDGPKHETSWPRSFLESFLWLSVPHPGTQTSSSTRGVPNHTKTCWKSSTTWSCPTETQTKRHRIPPELPWLQMLQRLGGIPIRALRRSGCQSKPPRPLDRHLDPYHALFLSLSTCHADDARLTGAAVVCPAQQQRWVPSSRQRCSATHLPGSAARRRPCAGMQHLCKKPFFVQAPLGDRGTSSLRGSAAGSSCCCFHYLVTKTDL